HRVSPVIDTSYAVGVRGQHPAGTGRPKNPFSPPVGRRSGPNNVLADDGILAPQVPFSDKVYRKAHPAMRTLEIRRHSFRKQGAGSQLSQEGVDYARRLGASIGPFARVVTSVVPRARETAIAMGFAVDEEIVTLASDEDMYAE